MGFWNREILTQMLVKSLPDNTFICLDQNNKLTLCGNGAYFVELITTFPSQTDNGKTISNPQNAIDRDRNTYANVHFSGIAGTDDLSEDTITFDLGRVYELLYILADIAFCRYGSGGKIALQISEDGSTYEDLISRGAAEAYLYECYRGLFRGVIARRVRYIRIYIDYNGSTGSDYADGRIYELLVAKLAHKLGESL